MQTLYNVNVRDCISMIMYQSNLHADDSPVSGSSMLFKFNVNDMARCRSSLCAIHMSARIPINCLGEHHHQYFIQNNNVHKVPANCTGLLIAYSTMPGVVRWKLGILLFQNDKVNVIYRIEVMSALPRDLNNYSFEETKVKEISITECPYHQIIYLNRVSACGTTPNGFIKCDTTNGPDIVNANVRSKKKLIKCLLLIKTKHRSLLPHRAVSLATTILEVDGLLAVLNDTRRKKKKTTMAAVGASVIEVEGPRNLLRHNSLKNKFLVPINWNEESCTAKYAIINSKADYKKIAQWDYQTPSKFEEATRILNSKYAGDQIKEPVAMKYYDTRDHPNGLIFLYRQNDNLQEMTVVKTWTTQKPTEHEEFDGLVLSHWHKVRDGAYAMTPDVVDLSLRVFGSTGFGDRGGAVASKGLNVYVGMKRSYRAIGTPK